MPRKGDMTVVVRAKREAVECAVGGSVFSDARGAQEHRASGENARIGGRRGD